MSKKQTDPAIEEFSDAIKGIAKPFIKIWLLAVAVSLALGAGFIALVVYIIKAIWAA